MANSVTNLDEIQSNQAQKEITANALFDAASPATVYGRRASTTAGLTWGYYGGIVVVAGGTASQIANGTLNLTASQTNYIVASKSDGSVSAATSTTNWDDDTNYWRLYSVVAGASTLTGWTDARTIGAMTGSGGGGGSSGDVIGPASSTADNIALFADGSGKLLKNGGKVGALAIKDDVSVGDLSASGTPSSTTFLRGDGTWATPPGGGSGGGDVNGPASAVSGNIAVFDGASGKLIKDGGPLPGLPSIKNEGTVSGTVALDFSTATNFEMELTGDLLLANPTNVVAGMSGAIAITQDSGTPRSIAYGAYWVGVDGDVPDLTQTAGEQDVIVYYATSTTELWFTMLRNQ